MAEKVIEIRTSPLYLEPFRAAHSRIIGGYVVVAILDINFVTGSGH